MKTTQKAKKAGDGRKRPYVKPELRELHLPPPALAALAEGIRDLPSPPAAYSATHDKPDHTIADLLVVCEELLFGHHQTIVQKMVERGYTEEEVDRHLKAFGERVGRDMGWS